MQIYVDMDGVLADFDAHHEAVFGIRSSTGADIVDWAQVRAIAGFYSAIPPMPDMRELWHYLERHKPIVLTGVPEEVEEAAENKRNWVRHYLGPNVEVICCKSKEKCLHAKPGDILIDDWEKYRSLWEAKDGIWITHVSAPRTILSLQALGI